MRRWPRPILISRSVRPQSRAPATWAGLRRPRAARSPARRLRVRRRARQLRLVPERHPSRARSARPGRADAHDVVQGSVRRRVRRGRRAVHLRLSSRLDRPARQPRAARRIRAPDAAHLLPRARAGPVSVVAPMFVTADDPAARAVVLEPGLPVQDMQPGGLVSGPDVRAYATREARVRLHQQRFKLDVMRAYRHRCAICALRERALVQAAHIVPDVDPRASPQSSTGLRCARSTISHSTATCSASIPTASSTSPVGCCARSTVRCCAPASRASTDKRSSSRSDRKIGRTRNGSDRASRYSETLRPKTSAEPVVGPTR